MDSTVSYSIRLASFTMTIWAGLLTVRNAILPTLFLFSCLLLSQPAWAAQASDCALKLEDVSVISYQGNCRNGFIDGKADVLYEHKEPDGKVVTKRQFGWFSDGLQSGLHLQLSPGKTYPAVVLLVYHKKPKKWVYNLSEWSSETLGDRSLYWSEITGVENVEQPDLTDEKGVRLPSKVQAGRLFDSLALRVKNNYIDNNYSTPSINAIDIQNFLNVVSKTHPFVSTNGSLLADYISSGKYYGKTIVRPDPDSVTKMNEVSTMDGCKFKVLTTSAKDENTKVAEIFEMRVWDGVCLDGWAYGPGTTRDTLDQNGAQIVVKYEWVQMGVPIGHFTISYPGLGLPIDSEGYIHPTIKDVYFIKTNLPGRQPEKGKIVALSKVMEDGSRLTFNTGSMWTSQQCGEKSKGCLVKMQFLPDHYYSTTSNGSVSPISCDKDCLEVWDKNAGAILNEMDAFIAQNKPKVDEIIRANTAALSRGTTLQQRLDMANQARASAERRRQEQAALKAMQEEAAAKKAAENKRLLDEANQANRPVSSPNLDALIKKIPLQQPKAKKGKKK